MDAPLGRASHLLIGILGCTSLAACQGLESELSLSAGGAGGGTLGAACLSDTDCALGFACFVDFGAGCLCEPGLTACGTTACVNTAADEGNCGACGALCGAGQSCQSGACVDSSSGSDLGPTGPLTSIDTPVQVSGGTPATTCNKSAELVPEDAANTGDADLFAAYMYVPGTSAVDAMSNWSTAWNTWSSSTNSIPLTTGDCCPSSLTCSCSKTGDAWSTTSTSTGLEYASFILGTSASLPGLDRCFGIAATTSSNIDNNVWTFPLSCIEDGGNCDGPAIEYDLGGNTLWAVARGNATGVTDGGKLYIMSGCGYGQPGGAACPVTSNIAFTGSSGLYHHPTIAVDPCNHLGLVAYRAQGGASDGDIILKIYQSNGTLVSTKVVDDLTSSSFSPATDCTSAAGCSVDAAGKVPKCTGACSTDCGALTGVAGRCLDQASKVSISAKKDPTTGHCYAYMAYDLQLGPATDGEMHFKSRLKVVRVDVPSSPTIVATYDSSSSSAVTNEFQGVSEINDYTKNVGFFFYRQRSGDPCDTIYFGRADTSLGLSTLPYLPSLVQATAFKSIRFSIVWHGMGHYSAPLKRGLPSGYLFPSWTEPIASSSSTGCEPCQSVNYNLRVMGTRVLP